MLLTQKYRPTRISELIGNKKVIDQIPELIEGKIPIILHGTTGIGKTSIAYAVASEYKYKLRMTNASSKRKKEDMKIIASQIKSDAFVPLLFLLDEIDGMDKKAWNVIEKVLDIAHHPIIMTANDDYKIPQKIKNKCKVLKLYKPNIAEIKNLIERIGKKEGIKPDLTGVSQDIRSSINSALGFGERFSDMTDFDLINELMTKGKIPERKLNVGELDIWILDNLSNYYRGSDLLQGIMILEAYSLSKNENILKDLPRGAGKCEYPRFYKRAKAAKQEKYRKEQERIREEKKKKITGKLTKGKRKR